MEGKCLCIKDIKEDRIVKDEMYTITQYSEHDSNYYRIYNSKGIFITNFERDSFYHKEMIHKHFITIKEFRKQKLQKIENI